MAFLQWRRFNFFDKEVVKNEQGIQVFDKLKDIEISVCTSGRGQMIFGDKSGFLYLLDQQLTMTPFKAFESTVTHLYQMKQHNILVSVGEDETAQYPNPLVKVWNLEKIDRNGNPMCVRISRAIPGSKPSAVTCLCVHENQNLMAIGFMDGSVVLYRGDITKERHSKHKVLHEELLPITALSFRPVPYGKSIILYVVTKEIVLSINVSLKEKEPKQILDKHGCSSQCCIMSDQSQDYQLCIGLQDAVYFYQPDGRGPCLAFDGEKRLLQWFRGYLVVVSKDTKTSHRPLALSSNKVEMYIVTVYDIQNKFIAYYSPMPAPIDVLCEWGSLYVIGGDSKLYHLQEKDTQSKLDMLFKKNFYTQAISLAKTQQYGDDGLFNIHRQYGDHLYSKGDHDGAITQYIITIGKLEASYVIRKFLDAQRIHNLTAYLQALHKQGLATEDHTTLLLNCYTKLKDVGKLDEFIMTKDKEVDFDVETAIKVLRQAGYYQHALILAEKHSQHDFYLKIQLEDIKDYNKALVYIAKLEFYEAENNMKTYGKMLMAEVPQETTELLKRLCTDYMPNDKPLVDATNFDGSHTSKLSKANADEFIHIFVNNSKKLTEFLEHMIKIQPASPSLVYTTLLELYLHDYNQEGTEEIKKLHEKKILDMLQSTTAKYDLDQALVLCQMNNFKNGILFLYEKSKLYQQILSYHMQHNEYSHIIDTCKRFGEQEPNLWIQALWYFAGTEENYKTYLPLVLAEIDKKHLLPPLQIIDMLAHNSNATISVVKDYLIKCLQQENEQIAEDERMILVYKEETEKMRNQIEEIKTSAKFFQVSKCTACNHPLELPSVHFLCQHSYHQQCFESYAEQDSECPACSPENKKVLDIIASQEQSRELHEQFHNQLERNKDGFSVVADYFGRGVFNKVSLFPDAYPTTQKKTSRTEPIHIKDVGSKRPSTSTNPFL